MWMRIDQNKTQISRTRATQHPFGDGALGRGTYNYNHCWTRYVVTISDVSEGIYPMLMRWTGDTNVVFSTSVGKYNTVYLPTVNTRGALEKTAHAVVRGRLNLLWGYYQRTCEYMYELCARGYCSAMACLRRADLRWRKNENNNNA